MASYNVKNLKNKIQPGMMDFKINNAIDDKVMINSGEEKDVLNLNITITDSNYNKLTINKYLIFVNKYETSQFGTFLIAATNALGKEDITPHDLKGLTGKVNYFIKNNNFPGLHDWQFDIPTNRSNQMLNQHINNQQFINNQPQMTSSDYWADAEEDY